VSEGLAPTEALTRGLLVAGAVYVGLLVVLGLAARRARREKSLSDFYLAGRAIGPFVLLLTLFATQYSGNSLSGFPGQTYREGLSYYMSVTFMVGIVAGYLLFAPRLFRLAREHHFVTPTDFLTHRFRSRALSWASVGIFSLVLVNFLLAQLMAMGHAASGVTGGRISYTTAVVGGAAIILFYELLGGMRAVAWTDALQGLVLMAGLLLVAGLLMVEVGSPAEVVRAIRDVAPAKAAAPSTRLCAVWISNFLLLGLGGPLYPQAIQRIYAARRLRDLKTALATMAWLPQIAITTVVFIGAAGIVLFPDLHGVEADAITFRVLAYLAALHGWALVPVILVMMAVIAAIMSTADSCLLSLSSIFTKDVAARLRGLSREESEALARLAPAFSIAIMGALVWLATRQLTTLWGLLVIKFELLIQLSPAFVLGTWHDRDDPGAFRAGDILAGLGVGLAVAVGLYATGHRQAGGLHAGTIGVAVNYLTCWLVRSARR